MLKNILNTLNMSEDDIIEANKKEERAKEIQVAHDNKWKSVFDKNPVLTKEKAVKKTAFLAKHLCDPLKTPIVKPTLKNLNTLISFSGSRFNTYKKKDFIGFIQREISLCKERADDQFYFYNCEADTGSFSAGATGNANKKTGGANFNISFTPRNNYSTYTFIVVNKMPILFLDSEVVLFSGFDYFPYKMSNEDTILLEKYRADQEKQRELLENEFSVFD